MKYLFVLTGFFLFTCNQAFGQVSDKMQLPVRLQYDFEIPVVLLEEINIKKLEKEDKEHLNSGLKSFRFADNIEVDIDTEHYGIWKTLPEGDKAWYLKIKSPGAYSLSVLFNHYRIPPGAKLHIYNTDKSHVRGAFTYKNNKWNYILPVAPVKGDEIVIEYYEPKEVDFIGEIHITNIAHDYKDILHYLTKDTKGFGNSGLCNININCETDSLWQMAKHSVCKITYNGWLCSGALINNTNNNGNPYFLTANHCINSDYDASAAVFYFNYESPDCINADGPVDQTISGSVIIAAPPVNTLDFTLLELSLDPPSEYKPYYSGWNRDITDPASVTSIHHPSGDIKKITKSYDGATTNDYSEGYNVYTHWWIDEWDEGTTEGGSSGSPLFNQNGELIGDLTGGDASCSYNFNDYYLQFHHAWQDYTEPNFSLNSWLDPDNSGIISLGGYLPYDTIPSHLKASLTDTVVNLSWNEVIDTANIDYYNIYRNSGLYDNSVSTDYQDLAAYKDSVYKYYVTAKITAGGESDPSNIIYIRSMDSLFTPFGEDFEGQLSLPQSWYEERSDEPTGWEFKAGGYSGLIDTAYEGSVNAYFYDITGESSKLVMPRFDFSGNTNVVLSFYLNMQEQGVNIDELKIVYKNNDLEEWKEIRSYNTDVSLWEKKSVSLPDLSDNYQIAFEAIGLGGYGICIDSVSLKEDGNYLLPVFSVSRDSVCINDDVIFSTTIDNSNILKWEFGKTAIPETTFGKGPHTVEYISGGIKQTRLTVNDTYIKEEINSVVVFDISTSAFVVTGNKLTSSSPYGNQWYLNENPIDGATNQLHEIVEDGDYYVDICGSASQPQYLVVYGIENPEVKKPDSVWQNNILIYPNPNTGSFTVYLNTKDYITDVNYKIIDITGKTLQTGKLDSSNNHVTIDDGSMVEGVCFIQIYSDDKYYTTKILIKK
ncbi:MAG: trypsin-like peptidase domain-containing protein [Bacteroidales bacterium]|nr:trypsin-like peptidase domain-containing protein [Bacteroidales bacterium]